jgi:tetratricopeptide (TPR) repeat protein
MKNVLLLLLIVCSKQISYSQTYEFPKQFSAEEKRQFLGLTKEIFKLNNNFSINLSLSDAKMSIKDMDDQIHYDESYLEKNKSALKKDSLNPYFLNNMAMYYESNGNAALAESYFRKSLKNLSQVLITQKDSARFYSLRSLLKVHLQEKDPIVDMEKALRINPLDSIGENFYPILLMNDRRFADLKQFCLKKFYSYPKRPAIAYTMFYMGCFWELMTVMMDENYRKANAKKEYDQLMDYKIINKYAEKYKANPQMQNITNMIDVSNLCIRMLLFETKENRSGFVLNFSEREKKRIAELQSVFNDLLKREKINAFSGNKSLSFLSYMQDKPDKGIEYAKKAIAALPSAKQSNFFNNSEMYDLLLSMYSGKNDLDNYKKTLEEKMVNSFDKSGLPNDYMNMAMAYLYQDNIDKADEWCRKAKVIDAENFNCLRLLAHLYFLNDSISLSQFYGETASKNMKSNDDSAWLSLQFAVYMIVNGNSAVANSAYNNIVEAKKSLDGNCPVCDELITKYIKVTP